MQNNPEWIQLKAQSHLQKRIKENSRGMFMSACNSWLKVSKEAHWLLLYFNTKLYIWNRIIKKKLTILANPETQIGPSTQSTQVQFLAPHHYHPQTLLRVIPEHRLKSKLWTQLDVAHTQTHPQNNLTQAVKCEWFDLHKSYCPWAYESKEFYLNLSVLGSIPSATSEYCYSVLSVCYSVQCHSWVLLGVIPEHS